MILSQLIRRLLLVFFLTSIAVIPSFHTLLTRAQGDLTPTPSGLVVVQGGSNLGNMQLFTLPQVFARTGLQVWRDSGWTGLGRKIGIIDRGFGELQEFAVWLTFDS